MRKQSTVTERFLWKYLRGKRLADLKWKRQEPIGNYIVDFICYEKRVIIECDGGQHASQIEEDAHRDQWFQKEGFHILRFWNNDVLKNREEVLQAILKACQRSPSPLSPPIKGGEEENPI